MKHASQFSTEHRTCVVCAHEYEVGPILIDRWRNDAQHSTAMPAWGLCPKHRELHEDGFIALIECDLAKSGYSRRGDRVKPETVHRTGAVAHLPRATAASIFELPADAKLTGVFVERGTIAKLGISTSALH